MSFDVYFQPCRYGVVPERTWQPPNQEPAKGAQGEPLTLVEQQAVRSILTRVCPRGPDKQGCWQVEVDDGGGAEVYTKDLRKGCLVALRGVTPDLVKLMFEILVAGNWVMLPTHDPSAIVASKDAVRVVPKGFPDVVVCATADALGAVLAEGG